MHAVIQGAGAPVILVHGLGAHSFSWRDTVATIGSGHRTYALDLEGFGGSPARPGVPCTMSAQVDALVKFMKDENIVNPVLIGHSMGGGICLGLAARAGIAPSKLILLAPVAYAPSSGVLAQNPFMQTWSLIGSHFLPQLQGRFLVKYILEAAYADPNRITQPQINGYLKGLNTHAELAAFAQYAQRLDEITVPETALGGIGVETLVIWGEDDTFLPIRNGERLVKQLPQAQLERIPSCGHIPHEEQPAAVNQLIQRFL
jgi:pimeloyl-ACP methyl ester carboxylesterase